MRTLKIFLVSMVFVAVMSGLAAAGTTWDLSIAWPAGRGLDRLEGRA